MNQPVQQSSDLPEIPGEHYETSSGWLYSADQMRDYARAAIAATQVVADQPSQQILSLLNEALLIQSENYGDGMMTHIKLISWAVKARILLASNAGKASSETTIRKAFVCSNCEGVYADQPVTACDCTHEQTDFIEGIIEYPSPASSEPAVAAIEARKGFWDVYEPTNHKRIYVTVFNSLEAASYAEHGYKVVEQSSTPAITPEL